MNSKYFAWARTVEESEVVNHFKKLAKELQVVSPSLWGLKGGGAGLGGRFGWVRWLGGARKEEQESRYDAPAGPHAPTTQHTHVNTKPQTHDNHR